MIAAGNDWSSDPFESLKSSVEASFGAIHSFVMSTRSYFEFGERIQPGEGRRRTVQLLMANGISRRRANKQVTRYARDARRAELRRLGRSTR